MPPFERAGSVAWERVTLLGQYLSKLLSERDFWPDNTEKTVPEAESRHRLGLDCLFFH